MARTKSANQSQPKDVEPAPHSPASTSRSPSPVQGPPEDSDSTSENLAENSSVPHSRAASPHPEDADPEAIPEDSVTCQWEDCGIVFTHLPTLIDHIHNEHIGVHKSSYTCEWATCQRRGLPQTSRFALISHIRSHTGEKPFTCPKPECDKSFTRSDALAKHMRLQHNIEPPAPGRGGNRKRKRGPEDPSSSATTMQVQGGNQSSAYPPASGVAGPSGFNTFKVEPRTPSELIDDLTGISQRERDYFGGPGYANGRQQRRSLSPHDRLPPSAPFPPSSHAPENSNGNDEGDENASGDLLPEYLAQHFDPKTGLVMGRTPAMTMYLLMKAKHRYALEQHDALMEELGAARIELKKAQDEKEGTLNEVLISCFGHQAEHLITPLQPPLGVQLAETQNPPPPAGAPELSYSLSSTSAPPYVNGHGR